MVLSAKQENSYNRYFINAFTQLNIDEIVEQGGASSYENFIEKAKNNIKDKGYWDALFNPSVPEKTFVGRDGKKRTSKFQAEYKDLGHAIYEKEIKPLADERVSITEYKRVGKEKDYYVVRKRVATGHKIKFQNKMYKGGQFLPKGFRTRL